MLNDSREIHRQDLEKDFIAAKNSRNCSGFVIFLILNKDIVFIAVKRDAIFYTRYVKVVRFVRGRYTKGVPFLSKMVWKRIRGWTSG